MLKQSFRNVILLENVIINNFINKLLNIVHIFL